MTESERDTLLDLPLARCLLDPTPLGMHSLSVGRYYLFQLYPGVDVVTIYRPGFSTLRHPSPELLNEAGTILIRDFKAYFMMTKETGRNPKHLYLGPKEKV